MKLQVGDKFGEYTILDILENHKTAYGSETYIVIVAENDFKYMVDVFYDGLCYCIFTG